MTEKMFPHLFSPLEAGSLTFRNRIAVAPHGGFHILEDGDLNVGEISPFIDLALSTGAAEIIIGETDVSKSGSRGSDTVVDWYDTESEHRRAIQRIAERVHSSGSKAMLELTHVGGTKVDCNHPAYGPMAIVNEGGIPVRAMTQEDIDEVCRDFAQAGFFLKLAGFDGVCVHFGHGWLFSQFLSERTN